MLYSIAFEAIEYYFELRRLFEKLVPNRALFFPVAVSFYLLEVFVLSLREARMRFSDSDLTAPSHVRTSS